MKKTLIAIALLATACTTGLAGGDMTARVDKLVAESFKPGPGQDLDRLKQDETLKVCSEHRNQPPEKLAAALVEREKGNLKYPADGKLMGDWKEGEKLIKAGFAFRIGNIEPDDPKKTRGGNCYACHALDKKEVAAGNLGPSLTGYGKMRGASEKIVKYTYDKLYNPQAMTACSNMPRLGHNGVLSPEQIAHIVAYLIEPESPVNQ
ncbi:MAG: sulfur oxidation c-type cytochrome SoxX [Thiotrichales bacterium]